MPTLSIGQRIRERPLWLPAVAGIVVNTLAGYGLNLDTEQLIGLYFLVAAIVTWWQQRKTTSVAKLERLEDQNVIVTHPRVIEGVVDVLKTPANNLPQNLPPVPPAAPAFPDDPLDRRR